MSEQRKASGGDTRKVITRADLRKATIHGLTRTKSDPQSVRLTPGQRRHIVSGGGSASMKGQRS